MYELRLQHPWLTKLLLASGVTLITMFCMFLFADKALAHGYIDSPGSRAYLCKTGANSDCGAIIYEPQSLEAPKGFPQAGPADGKIASAGGIFPKLDEQSATRWSKVNISSGPITFHWTLTAAHATTSWKYYITKPNWNPNAALTRDSFDLTPFCSVDYNGKRPPFSYSDNCNVPARTGYHVILAVWEIADTANAFYNVIDVNFGGSNPVDNQAPTAPTGLASSNVTSTTAALSWNAATDNVGVTGYKVYRNGTEIASVSGSTLNYTATGLTGNTSYTFTVRAVDAAGNTSPNSNAVVVNTPVPVVDTEAPSAPTGLHVMGTPTSTSVNLMWSASTDNVGVTGYQIFRGSTLVATVSGSTLEYNVTGLTASTSYTFTVKAVDAAGNVSAASSAVNATTAAPPAIAAWAPGVSYAAGTKVTYNGNTYECRQAHTSLVGWEPATTPALWLLK
ncbi:lytic polysaccharide monooxygenase [Paenibacillus sp. 1001270B_150601_E10]|uniref:lytic polysaccharide monooxygenase n=1 Tax=Paenibacillus sp. 1001270B_150601_E10 TaxID=2787079 RepID=UPI00189DAE33|nr:lytic polysaccharide monooxygenase [Paenibacillus sp. 1001270B_150601_E10]